MDLLMDKHQEFHHKAFKLHFLKGLAYPRWLSWPEQLSMQQTMLLKPQEQLHRLQALQVRRKGTSTT